jgi:hypothetical protein
MQWGHGKERDGIDDPVAKPIRVVQGQSVFVQLVVKHVFFGRAGLFGGMFFWGLTGRSRGANLP